MKFSEIGIGEKFSPVGSNAEYKKVSANEGQLLHCRVVIDFPSSAKVCPTKDAADSCKSCGTSLVCGICANESCAKFVPLI